MNVPSRFGRYEVKRILGQGDMGTVYLAEDPVIGRPVAIKAIDDHLNLGSEELGEVRTRFEREIRIAGTFSHPNIVTVHDVGLDEHGRFIATEYLDGGSLATILAEERTLPFEQVSELTLQIGSALDYAHAHDIVHRDVKPANVLLTSTGVPKLTDFGVARLAGSTLTRHGTAYGSPAYMSPEQAAAQATTGASDQFSLGVIVYQMLTGELPFAGDSATAVVFRILKHDPVPPELLNPLIPNEVGELLMRALAKNPSERYPSCTAFAEALGDALGTPAARPGDARRSKRRISTAAIGSSPRAAVATGKGTPGFPSLWVSVTSRLIPPSAWLLILLMAVVAVLAGSRWLGNGREEGISTAKHESATTDPPGMQAADAPRMQAADALRMQAADAPRTQTTDPPRIQTTDTARIQTTDQRSFRDVSPSDEQSFVVISKPSGALVILDNRTIGATPTEVQLSATARHRLQLELEGYERVSWSFSLDDLNEEHFRTRNLLFPLDPRETQPASVPETLVEEIQPADVAESPVAEFKRVLAPAKVPYPQKIHHVDPVYAERDGAAAGGYVILTIEVDAHGNVIDAKVLRSLTPALDQAAIAAARQWKYAPTTYEGEQVHVLMNITVRFPPR